MRFRSLDGATRAAIADFDAFDASFRGGVRVAVGDVNGDGLGDLLLGTGPGAGQVKVLDGNGLALLGLALRAGRRAPAGRPSD